MDNNQAATSAAGPHTPLGNDKPRLTEQEKKSNHIASEQKRRQAIREGFDEIADLTPGMRGQGRSEAMVLQNATAHMRRLLAERWRLVQAVRERGGEPGDGEMDAGTMELGRSFAAEEDGGG